MAKTIQRSDSTGKEMGIVDEAKKPEVSTAVFSEDKMVVVSSDTTLSDAVQGLLGQPKDKAVEALNKLKADKKITEYRVAPIGAMLSMDFRRARVTLTTDVQGKVVDAQIG